MSIVIAIMAKDPRGADVKTRLAPRLDAGQRSRVYQAFLADKLAAVQSVGAARSAIVYTPASSRDWFDTFAGSDTALYPQRDGALGERVVAAFDALFRDHADGVILTDSDTPNLPPSYLTAAVDALAAGHPLVLGPAEDGGYYAVGMSAAQPAMFANVAWSSPSTLQQTVAGAARLGIRPFYLPSWYDVDEPDDLERLGRDITAGRGGPCPHTANALRAHR